MTRHLGPARSRALLLAVIVAGCSAHPGITVEPDPTGSSAMTATSLASPSFSQRVLPPGFPLPDAAVPIPLEPDGSTVGAWTVDLHPAAVYDWFVQALPANGLPLDAAYPGGGGAVLHFRDGDGGTWELRIGGDSPARVEVAPRD